MRVGVQVFEGDGVNTVHEERERRRRQQEADEANQRTLHRKRMRQMVRWRPLMKLSLKEREVVARVRLKEVFLTELCTAFERSIPFSSAVHRHYDRAITDHLINSKGKRWEDLRVVREIFNRWPVDLDLV